MRFGDQAGRHLRKLSAVRHGCALKRRKLRLLTGGAALILSIGQASAQTTVWTGAASADWFDPGNWTNGLPLAGSGTTRIDTNVPNAPLIDGGAAAVSRGLYVGDTRPGSLTIAGGATLSSRFASLGEIGAGGGTVLVTGTGSRWDVEGGIIVGGYGAGTIVISDGATVEGVLLVGLDSSPSSTGDGTVTVTGAGSLLRTSWPEIDGYRNGRMNVLDGGRVETSSDAYLAIRRQGDVLISGAGSLWKIDQNLEIGWRGQGSLTVADGGSLRVHDDIVLAAHADGTGTLNIGAASGAAAVAPGAATASRVAFGPGAGRIVFNHTGDDYSFSPAISGSGEIRVEAGRTALAGDHSGFTGTTIITGGTLSSSGVLRGTLGISQAGRLSGTGTFGNVDIVSGGTIAPGNSIGTLTIDGDATFAPGSRYEVEVDPAGTASDHIHVTGKAILDGGSVVHVGETGTYRPKSTYHILSAAGGVEGRFDEVRSEFAFLDPALSYGANDVHLSLKRNDISFEKTANSTNQKAAATALDTLTFGDTIYDAVVILDETQARSAFEQLSGEIHATAKSPLIGSSGAVRNIVEQRLRGTLSGGRPPGPREAYASLDALQEDEPTADRGLWGRAFGSWGRVRGDAQASGVRHDEGGFLIGADRDLADAWALPAAFDAFRVGAFGGYSRSTFNLDTRTSSGMSHNTHLGLYGNAEIGSLRVAGGVTHTLHQAASVRRVSFPGLDETLTASYRARTTQLFGETGYRIATGALAFEPFAGLGFVHFARDGYREDGGAAALTVARGTQNSAFSTLGLRAFGDFRLGALPATAHGMIGWRQAFTPGRTSAEVSLAGTGSFRISGAPVERNTAVTEAGIDLGLSESATLSVSYDGRRGARSAEHGVTAKLHASF